MFKNPNPKPKKTENGPDVTDENYTPKVSWFSKIPYWVKAVVLKYWFIGMEFYFFMMGLGYFFQDKNAALVLMVVFGFAHGVFNEIFTYPILDVMERIPGQKDSYVLFKSKHLYSLFINVLYGLVFGYVVILINALIRTHLIAEADLSVYGFLEPLVVSAIGLVIDCLVVETKNLGVWFYHRIIKKQTKEEWSCVR